MGLLILGGIGEAQSGAQQQQPPIFRSGLDVGRVTFRVLDKNRRPIRDLTKDNFTVLVDGKPRPVLALATEDAAGPTVPSAPWIREVAPDVVGNALVAPRLVVIILDDGLTPDAFTLRTAKAIANKAIDELGPNDLASIVFTKDNRKPRDFTADRSKLRTTVDKMELGFDIRQVQERAYAERQSLHTVRAAVEFLRTVPDLKSLVLYVTIGPKPPGAVAPQKAGIGTNPGEVNQAEAARELSNTYADVLGAVHSATVPVYGISTMGLIAPNQDIAPGPGMAGKALLAVKVAEAALMNETLRNISDSTGGHAIFADNSPSRLVPAVFAENGFYYTLGYEADGPLADGRFRRLEVRVNRSGVTVEPSGERMFYSPKVSGSVIAVAPPTSALSQLVSVADEPLRMAVAAFADLDSGPNPSLRGSVGVTMGIEVPASPGLPDDIDLELRVFNAEGTKQLDARKQTMHVPASASTRAYNVLMTLALKPGQYNLRMAAHSALRNQSGSVHTDVTVPDYTKSAISMSDAILSSTPGPVLVPATAPALLPFSPTTIRQFDSLTKVTAFVRVYSGKQAKSSGTVSITALITDSENHQVFKQATSVSQVQFGPLLSADYSLEIPTAELRAGEHLLSIKSRSESGAEVTKFVRFTIRQ